MDVTNLAKCDFNALCRLCLNRDGPLTCLFSNEPDEIPLYLMVQTCAAVDIDEEDGLPPNICCVCRETILSSYQFRQQVCRNDTILRCVAGMKADPEVEEAVVAVRETPVIVDSGGSDPQDGGAANDKEVELCLEGFNDDFLIGGQHPTGCEDTRSRVGIQTNSEKAAVVKTEKISKTPKNEWTNSKSDTNPNNERNRTIRLNGQNSVGPDDEVLVKMREYGTPAADGSGYCCLCHKIFCRFYEHVQLKHLKTGGFWCDHCDVWCNSEARLSRHINSVHVRKSREMSSDRNMSFKTSNAKPVKNSTESREILAKIVEFGAPDGDGYYCKQCKGFYTKRKFISHLKRSHLKIRNFICDGCGRSFLAKASLTNHIQNIHLDNSADEVHAKMKEYGTHAQNTDSYYCKLCQKLFIQRIHFFNHVKFTHLQIRDFMCDQCGYRAFSKPSLTQHIEAIHLQVKKYQCPHCPLRFCTKRRLNVHARTRHRPGGARMVMCEVCGKSVRTPQELMRHLRAQHFPELRLKCEFCDRSYTRSSHLRNHVNKMH